MAKEREELASHISRTEAAVSQMRGKAPKGVVAQKEASLAEAKELLTELEKSVAALQ